MSEGVMTTCSRCGDEYPTGGACKACNRARVYRWRNTHRERWNAIQNKSRRKQRDLPERIPDVCEVCGGDLSHRRPGARCCSKRCNNIAWRAARYQARHGSVGRRKHSGVHRGVKCYKFVI